MIYFGLHTPPSPIIFVSLYLYILDIKYCAFILFFIRLCYSLLSPSQFIVCMTLYASLILFLCWFHLFSLIVAILYQNLNTSSVCFVFFLFFFPQHYLPQLLFEIKQCLIIIINIWYSYRWLFLSPSFFSSVLFCFYAFCSLSLWPLFFLSKRIKDTIFSIGWNDRGKLVKIMRAWICGAVSYTHLTLPTILRV